LHEVPMFPWLMAWAPWLFYHGVVYLMFAVPALFFLRTRNLDETSKAVWALLVVTIPIMGCVAFAVLQPGRTDG
jgi:drug/metabolite transporter (DMT)-like permease